MYSFLQDAHYGLRALRKNPGFTLVAVLTFALGIGAIAAMFSVVKSVLLASLPFPDSDRVMVASQKMANGQPNLFSTPDFLEWKRQSGALPQLAAFVGNSFTLGGSEASERIAGARVSFDLFPILGTQPILGRGFTVEEDRLGGTPVAIISHALWITRFQRDPGVIGQSLALDGTKYTIIGVMPAGFSVFSNTELLWTPLQLPAEATGSSPNVHWLRGVVRLAAKRSQAQTQAALDALAARMHRHNASDDAGFGVVLTPVRDSIIGNVRPALLLLMGCVSFVLLIACANVANLLLARGTARRRELSIRAAMGARRSRMVRQLVTESVLLAGLGGLVGIALAFIAIKVLFALHPTSVPVIQPAAIDAPVLGYALLMCITSGILFGLFPALGASRLNLSDALKEGSTGAGGSIGRQRAALAVLETSLALMLLIGSGLALKSLWLLGRVDPGFEADNVLTFRISAPAQLAPERLPDFYREVAERMRTLPGAKSVTLARDLPMSGIDPSMPVTVPGHALALADTPTVIRFRAVGPDYFHTLGTPLLRGREFADTDTAAAPGVVIVSQSLAKLYWPGEDVIEKSLTPQAPGAHSYTVVGEVADVRHWSRDIDIEPTAYYPYTQVPDKLLPLVEKTMSVAVRTDGPGADIVSSIRSAVANVNKDAPVFGVQTMNKMLADSGSLRRFDLLLLGTFAALALALATVGIYGVIAYWVSQRTREIGIRMAMGARRRDVLELVVRHGLKIGILGIIFGVAGALALSRVMSSLLYGVSSTDPVTFAVVAVMVGMVVLLACLVPARRATRVDLMVALRCE